jgi:hypothetical protein
LRDDGRDGEDDISRCVAVIRSPAGIGGRGARRFVPPVARHWLFVRTFWWRRFRKTFAATTLAR